MQRRFINIGVQRKNKTEPTFRTKNAHCYRALFPFDNLTELAEHLASSIVYNKNGLIAINKPYGIKIHGHDKPGTRSKDGQRFLIPSIPECDLTLEGALGELQERLNVPPLTILKSAERFSGLLEKLRPTLVLLWWIAAPMTTAAQAYSISIAWV
ncbi:hypothetical protein AVEN_133957-1 [Araneus ventricosus]|uniref:RNA pseudouridylate synthase domain-containing protein 4 n=1 Tax=Araneus ventricosus TaxID=182803 RepID=A0A4Y2RSC1_ARAVE|nr:hypothetical protein AVEN_133957-1 [Araneus ventricosus]